MLKQFSFISMGSSHVVTEHESKTLWLSTALFFIVLSWTSWDCTAPASTAGLETGTSPLRSPPAKAAQGWAALGHGSPPERGIWGGVWGLATEGKGLEGGKGEGKGAGGGGKRAGKGAGGGKQAGKGAELRLLGLSRGSCCCPIPVPLPTQPTVEVQPSCLAPLVLPVLLTIVLTFPNLQSSTAKGKVGRAESSMRAEHPQRTAGTKPERRASALGREEKGEHLLCLKWKAK